MRNRLTILLSLGALALALPAAHAEKADRNKPMNIEADALRHDELKQTSVFTGRVVMTKGTIVLRGAQLEVRQDPDGFQHGVVTAEPGKRAFFRQKRDTLAGAPDEFVEGEGEVIEYDGRTDIVKLMRRAELRRYREARSPMSWRARSSSTTTHRRVHGGWAKTAPRHTGGTPGARAPVLGAQEPASRSGPVRGNRRAAHRPQPGRRQVSREP